MPDVFIFEMFCDRVAASKIYNGENYTADMPLAYFMRAKHRRIIERKLLQSWNFSFVCSQKKARTIHSATSAVRSAETRTAGRYGLVLSYPRNNKRQP